MSSLRSQLSFHWERLWRRRWWAAAVAWVVCAIGWAGLSRIPDQYESLARIYMSADQALSSLLHGISVDDDMNARLDRMQRTLLSAPNMKKLIEMTDLASSVRNTADQQLTIAHLQHAISIKPQTSNLFTVSYRDPDPVMAQSVVSNLLSIFMEASEGDTRTDINGAQRFVETELDRLETALRAAEQKKSAFQSRYYDLLPSAGSASSALEQARISAQQINDDLSDALAERANLQKEIAGIPPYELTQTADSLPGRDQGLSLTPETRLGQLTTQLEIDRATMTEQHPVVVALQHQIDALKAQIAAKGGSAAETARPPGQTVNPLYRELKVKLVDQDSKIASLRRRLQSAQENRDRMEAEARAAPGVGAEFINISRDYDVIKRNYDQLLERRESARITEDEDKKGTKLDVRTIDTPEVPTMPVGPQRVLYASLILAAGVAAGIATAFILSELDTSFSSATGLQVFGLPVVGVISFDQRFHKRKERWFAGVRSFSAVCVMLFAAYGGLVLTIFFEGRGV